MLAEAGLALLVLILAVWLAADLVGQLRQRRRCDQFIADLREFSEAFQRHARLPKAALPARTDEGALPPGVAAQLKETNWSKGSPFGGAYEWLPPPVPAPSAATATATAAGAVASQASMAKATTVTAAMGESAPAAKPVEKRVDGVAPAASTARTAATRAPAARGAITVTAYAPNWPLTLTPADLLRIDRRIDDGNLATGRFRTGFNGWPVYEIVGK